MVTHEQKEFLEFALVLRRVGVTSYSGPTAIGTVSISLAPLPDEGPELTEEEKKRAEQMSRPVPVPKNIDEDPLLFASSEGTPG